MINRKNEALVLAEELLSDIELRRLEPIDIARKASRLARLTEDIGAMSWLKYEVSGYPEGTTFMDPAAWEAAMRSNRTYKGKEENQIKARIASLGHLQATVEASSIHLRTATDPSHNISSANPYQHVSAPAGNANERLKAKSDIVTNKALMDKVIGAIHSYCSDTYQSLRFGAAAETAFDTIRSRVDKNINDIVPKALPILNTAFENAADDNPVQWGNAAKACRDLIVATADALRPAGPPVKDRPMTKSHYVNRLIDWVESNSKSSTMTSLVISDLSYLGNRLDAVTTSGNKGAHTTVSKNEASRYIVGTYIFMGDILDLSNSSA